MAASSARRVVLNRAAFDAITLAIADGLFELAKAVIDEADVPDAAPYGEGLVKRGGVLAYVGSKRVGVYATGGQTAVNVPRGARLGEGVTVIGGYGFPSRFLEIGTIHNRPRAFLTPALMAHIPDADKAIQAACFKAGVISAKRRARGGVFGASKAKA